MGGDVDGDLDSPEWIALPHSEDLGLRRETALRVWCGRVGIDLVEDPPPADSRG
ncbi:MAG: hypothetical protein MUE73_11335 [Planctomycetes bacterium]|nr:hypothetical protein [Planctomycetota bacterium]